MLISVIVFLCVYVMYIHIDLSERLHLYVCVYLSVTVCLHVYLYL